MTEKKINRKATDMDIKKVAVLDGEVQDGAIWGNLLFRFTSKGECMVYDVSGLPENPDCPKIASFILDRADIIPPHSNAAVFGKEYFAEGDEFPLLYSNMYNNFAEKEDMLKGSVLVYRLERAGDSFKTTLLQIIQVGFTEDTDLWHSEDKKDARPYGNFVVDRDSGKLYAFTMRDMTKTTRYFAFNMPGLDEGEMDERFGVRRAVLEKEDILEYFDTPYHNFLQGAVLYEGKVYSTEGFHERIHPAIRIIDVKEKKELLAIDLFEAGLPYEAEFVDFKDGVCYYGDHLGNIFKIDF